MAYQVRVNPIFYNRLTWALERLADSLGYEVEFVSRHLDDVKAAFSEAWRELDDAPGALGSKMVVGALGHNSEVIYAVTGRQIDFETIEIRNITIVGGP